jgi:hypothetical protein
MRWTAFAPIFCLSLMSASTSIATPDIKVTPSRASIQKGTNFEIRMEITAPEGMSNVTIAPLVPDGFTLKAVASPGIELATDTSVVKLKSLPAGSNVAIVFRGTTPGVMTSERVSTEESKTFTFNVFYEKEGQSGQARSSQFVNATVKYTTHISIYLATGLLGVWLGYLIKTGIKKRDELSKSIQGKGLKSGLRAGIGSLMSLHLDGLFIILIIGVGALLIATRDGLPAANWYTAMAMGIGLGLLADEQLLGKLGGAAK